MKYKILYEDRNNWNHINKDKEIVKNRIIIRIWN